MEIELAKVAWIRDPTAPHGRSAKGRLNCPCGQAPLTWLKPEQGNVVCACGRVYTWDGWRLLDEEEEKAR